MYLLTEWKKFYPSLNTKVTYKLNFGTKIKKNNFVQGVRSYPDFSVSDVNAPNNIRTGVFFEEVPTTAGGIASINISNQGFGYTKTPSVKIIGDGTGAEAYAVLNAGRIVNIVVTNPGFNYTQATVEITNAPGDTSGALASGIAVLNSALGSLRTYYFFNNTKVILNPNAGTIDYNNGIVTLTNFAPISINNELGVFNVSAIPDSTIVSSSFNRIVSLDEFDSDAIKVTVIAQ